MKRHPFFRHPVLVFLASALSTAADDGSVNRVGRLGDGRLLAPVDQLVTPAGRQVDLPGARPLAVALSPDERLLATAGKSSELILVDPSSATPVKRVPLPSDKVNEPDPAAPSPNILVPDTKGQQSYTGLIFSPDGRRIYLSNVNGSVKVFAVETNGDVRGLFSIPLPPAGAPRRKEEIPAGLALSKDGARLFVCGNLSNRLLEFEAENGRFVRAIDVGVAPYDVVTAGRKAYVSNWGGRRPGAGDLTGPAGRGTVVRVDPVRHIASEGSVSVIDLDRGTVTAEILVQLHASALALSPDGRHLACANAGSDTISVIDTRTDKVVETIWAKANPSDLLGASPNALCFDPKGRRLYAANGTQNAVAVIDFDPGESKLLGLIPAGWFPGGLAFDGRRRQLCVSNIKSLPAQKTVARSANGSGYNSHQYTGSLSLIPLPGDRDLPALSETVYRNLRRERIEAARLPARSGQPPRPVPERVGEPSVFKHVVYIIKENRTYDQVLGDVAAGNGDPGLCIFGERVTPNQHKMVRDFVLLDNTYCCGILSADGHQWSTTAFGTDYLERSFAGWPRSYPDGMGPDDCDALAYSPAGFIWDNALKHGVSIWNFGEFTQPECGWADPTRKGSPGWTDYWKEFKNGGGAVRIGGKPTVATLTPFTPTNYVGWNMSVPDVWRARYITNQIAAWDREGRMPQLILICLPNDHTSGTSRGNPTPAATVADNDLAFGQILESLGKSRFWKETVVFAIEDDPQNGWDHVSGYRTTAYVISPWTKRGATVSTLYNTTSLIRTIEQILGLPPMNQFDAAATPMFDCFADAPDFTPFTAVANNIPLDQMNGDVSDIRDRRLRRDVLASERMDFRLMDRAPEDALNRILWRAIKGPSIPYPEWAVTLVQDDDD